MSKIIFFTKKILPRHPFLCLRGPYHFLLALWAALFYGFPSRKLFVIGVTGTNGKTTVVELLHEILREAGHRTASASSLRFKTNDEETKNELKMTMPGRMFLQNFLHEAVKNRCAYAILEVTSEGIAQSRHRFIGFDCAVMTNVAPEHIESHGSFENYLRAKLDLFWRLAPHSLAVINRDDPLSQRFWAAGAGKKIWYGKEGIESNGKLLPIKDYSVSSDGISIELGSNVFFSPLLGEFNFYNILAAVTVALERHVGLEKIARALARVGKISGRMEFLQKEPFAVVVDYAHTPDSLRQIYETIRESIINYKLHPERKLICVLGAAGGGRDTWKRPVFGEIASEFCQKIILTNEDPYDEDPAQILSQIESGISNFPASPAGRQFPISKILDRREAIREALQAAEQGDTVVITGKGAEPWIMAAGGEKIAWDDRQVAREELEKLPKGENSPHT